MDSVILAREALKLPAWERAQIIDALWKSLDPAEQAAVDESWLAECRERFAAHKRGELGKVNGDQALKDIEDGLRS